MKSNKNKNEINYNKIKEPEIIYRQTIRDGF